MHLDLWNSTLQASSAASNRAAVSSLAHRSSLSNPTPPHLLERNGTERSCVQRPFSDRAPLPPGQGQAREVSGREDVQIEDRAGRRPWKAVGRQRCKIQRERDLWLIIGDTSPARLLARGTMHMPGTPLVGWTERHTRSREPRLCCQLRSWVTPPKYYPVLNRASQLVLKSASFSSFMPSLNEPAAGQRRRPRSWRGRLPCCR
jgi:hypothetical protein